MTSDNLYAVALVIHACLPKRQQVASEEKFMETLRKTGF